MARLSAGEFDAVVGALVVAQARETPLGLDDVAGRAGRGRGAVCGGELRREPLRRALGGGLRLGRKPVLQPLSGCTRLRVSGAGRDQVPLVGLGGVAGDAQPLLVEPREVVFTVDQPLVGGAMEPVGGLAEVLRTARALEVVQRQIVHRLDVAAFGGPFGPGARLAEVLLQPGLAALVELRQVELRRRVAQVGGALQRHQARVVVRLDAANAVGIELRGRFGLLGVRATGQRSGSPASG